MFTNVSVSLKSFSSLVLLFDVYYILLTSELWLKKFWGFVLQLACHQLDSVDRILLLLLKLIYFISVQLAWKQTIYVPTWIYLSTIQQFLNRCPISNCNSILVTFEILHQPSWATTIFGVLRVFDTMWSIKCMCINVNDSTLVISIKILCICISSDEAIAQSGMPTSKNSLEMENHVFLKAKSKVSTSLCIL